LAEEQSLKFSVKV